MEVEQLINGIKKLTPTPKILPELRRLLKDSESCMNEIISLIKVDNALASQIIRVSNTPFYGATTPSNSIEEAINRIGFHEVYKLVAFLVASQALCEKNAVYDLAGSELFRDSIICGLLMQSISRAMKGDDDTAYTIGLMNSIGKTAINAYYLGGKKAGSPRFDGHRDTHSQEYRKLGFSHAEVGGALLVKWKFQDEVTRPIACQHKPDEAGEFTHYTHALYVVKRIAPYINLEIQDILEKVDLDSDVIEEIGIHEDDLIDGILDAKTLMADMSDLIPAS